jgi:heat shock protein beta
VGSNDVRTGYALNLLVLQRDLSGMIISHSRRACANRVHQRELISNSNDELEKLRLVSLTDKSIVDSGSPLNITIKAIKDEDNNGGKLVITGENHKSSIPTPLTRCADTGIGMTPEEMITNLVN